VSMARVLKCDKCGTTIGAGFGLGTLNDLRDAAYHHGWRVAGSARRRLFDLCPVCSLTWRGEEKTLVAEMEGKT
jgi:hypothetical protein